MPNDLVSVYIARGQVEAQLIKSLLEAEGIPAMVSQEGAGAAYGLTVGILGVAEIFVAEKNADEAKKLIEEMKGDDGESEEK